MGDSQVDVKEGWDNIRVTKFYISSSLLFISRGAFDPVCRLST